MTAVLLVLSAWLLWTWLLAEPVRTRLAYASPDQKTVIFVVLDTTRADHLSACGYERPTSPNLQALARSGSLSCQAYAPGSWTYPSHASFFTGLPVTEHGSHFVGEGEVIRKLTIRPLDPDLQTLAQTFTERGYQTAGLSSNPVLAPASGLDRGFGTWRTAEQFGPWYGRAMERQLTTLLREDLDPERPLFLFLNLADAHDPWDGVPEGLDWVPAREDFLLYFRLDEGELVDGEWAHYVTRRWTEEQDSAFRERITDLYDHALSEADQTLANTLAILEAHGWMEDVRLVVVSDHGEFLGEHQLARHGRYLWEPNQRVPLLFVDEAAPVQLPPGPLSALVAHALVLDGRLPSPLPPALAVAFPDKAWLEHSDGLVGGSTSAAVWTEADKQLWQDGVTYRIDLDQDPEELRPVPTEPSPALSDLVTRAKVSQARELEMDPQLEQALRAAGYLE
jgi:arylsulfatase A-like enzyme